MTESLWLDEATTSNVASNLSVSEIFTKFLPGDFHPPLYYLFMKFWVSLFGNSEISLRFPSLIFAALTLYFVYRLAGKTAALLLSTAPLLFYYAQEARMYAMTVFFVVLSMFSFVKITKKGGVGWWILFSISLGLIAATDYVALLILPIFWYLGIRFWKKLLASHIILLGFWAVWFPFFLSQLTSGLKVGYDSPAWAQLLGQTSFKNIALIPIKFMIGRVSFADKWLYGLVVGLATLLFGYLVYRARKADKIYWLWLLMPVVLGVVLSFKLPILSYFRFLFVLPAFYILVAQGIGRSRLLLFLVLGVSLLSTMYYVLTPKFHREDWRGAAHAIGGDQIVIPANSQKEALIYYGKGDQIVTIQELSSNSYEQIWLSRYVWEVSDPADTTRLKIEELGYKKLQEYNFNGVVVWKYARSN